MIMNTVAVGSILAADVGLHDEKVHLGLFRCNQKVWNRIEMCYIEVQSLIKCL